MIRDGKVVKTVMRSFSMNEISAVDRPAQQEARAAIMKRDDVAKAGYAMAITTVVAGHTHLVSMGGGEYTRRAGDTSYVDGHCHPWIMNEAGDVILGHALGHNHGIEVITKREFSGEQRASAAESGAAMPDGSYPIETLEDLKNAISAFGRAKDQAAVARHIKRRARALDATNLLPDSGVLADLLGKNDSASETQTADDLGQVEDNSMTQQATQSADIAAVEKKFQDQVAVLTKRAERAEAVASLSDAHRAFHKSLTSKEAADAFLAADEPTRNTEIAKAQDANAVVYTAMDGSTFRKSDDPRLAKMAQEMDAEKKKRMKMEAEAYKADLEKRAAELAHIPGDLSVRVSLLKGIDSLPAEERTAATAALKSQNERLAKAFETVGTSAAPSADENLDPLDAMASDIAKRDGVSFEKAYSKALATSEGQKLYNQHVAKRMNPSV
jgi:hypothetical protein